MKKIYIILIGLMLAANTNVFSQSFGSEITLEEVTVTGYYNNNDWSNYWYIQTIIYQVNEYYNNNPGTTQCDGQVNSGAYYDDCGVCVGGTTGQSPCSPPQPPVDCAGVTGGSAYLATCGCIGGTTGITDCSCPNDPFVASSATIAGGYTPSQALTWNEWGKTWPEKIEVDITACLEGGSWKAIVSTINGGYSLRARLILGCMEILGPGTGGNTVNINYCDQVNGLNGMGLTSASLQWFMVSAVQAHENVHLTHFEPELETLAPSIESDIEALSVPATGQTEAAAIAQIKALPAYQAALDGQLQSWLTTLLALGGIDHSSGTAQAAMVPILSSMKSTICSYASSHSWPFCAGCF